MIVQIDVLSPLQAPVLTHLRVDLDNLRLYGSFN